MVVSYDDRHIWVGSCPLAESTQNQNLKVFLFLNRNLQFLNTIFFLNMLKIKVLINIWWGNISFNFEITIIEEIKRYINVPGVILPDIIFGLFSNLKDL